MNIVKLSEVAQIIMGQSPPSETYNFGGIGLPFFQGKTDFGDLHPFIRVFCSEPIRIAEPDDILISVRAPVGPTNVASCKCCIGRGLSAIRCHKNMDMSFLLYYLRFYEKKLLQSGQGSTFDAINKEDLENIPVPLPPLSEQQRIAAILAAADAERRRRYTQSLSDNLLRETFIQMFGDPVTNPMGWKVKPLNSIASVNRGRFSPRPRNDPQYYGGIYPFIQTGDIAKSGSIITTWSQTLNERGIRVSKAFDIGDIVIAIVGATIGETALLDIKAYCPDSIVGISINKSLAVTSYVVGDENMNHRGCLRHRPQKRCTMSQP